LHPTDNAPALDFKGLTSDSRQVRDGYLFAALPGSKSDGRSFIADAIQHGASCILAPVGTVLPPDAPAHVRMVTDSNPRRAFALLAAAFYNRQPGTIAAVTGTSGKTSTVAFAQQLWHLSSTKTCASIGTLGVRGPGMIRSGSLTTPDPVALHAELADLASAGITHLAMEASSHGLDQYRLDGVKVSAAGFTNLSRDHLDYHKDMELYFLAKSRLFSDILPPGGTAVINVDDPYAARLQTICKARGQRVITFGAKGHDITLKSRRLNPGGQDIVIAAGGRDYAITLPLVGEFQAMNALCALGLVMADGTPAENLIPLLELFRGVAGRLQLVPGHVNGAAVYVDYAHKPAALEAVLTSLRPHTEGKLVCLFGCGGDRDSGKRPMMGTIAARLADAVIVTDDNPRSEDPAAIRAAILDAAPGATEIPGRRDAIRAAVAGLGAGDVLLIAGKGHEKGQIIGGQVEPFDDVEEAGAAMDNLQSNRKRV